MENTGYPSAYLERDACGHAPGRGSAQNGPLVYFFSSSSPERMRHLETYIV